ncbi:Glycoside hydrolase family 31 protein [Mycena indigotica]|uniref:Glycoside hydrolase family 31 protein n=1 Tax=Mycena indigotica TaxID=2126181 RepID=A0A8H6SSG1_9AGAR|nr:Glycoside hydrolase family 31 protein [Mycena indigotica]KAF7304057.1 Glycoside hydrolase family 31 protein [Mycena indigotica]
MERPRPLQGLPYAMARHSAALLLLFFCATTFGGSRANVHERLGINQSAPANGRLSLSVASCPGYALSGVATKKNGFSAKLGLAGPACNAFGVDVKDLTLEVTYETESRLHVNIFDTANSQFTIPASVFEPPKPSGSVTSKTSDLVFNYNKSPFEFWITRRTDPHAAPLFDTRKSSLPPTPIPAVIPTDNSTALEAFPLVFENQYLQLTSALPLDANVYGLGEVIASSGLRRDVGTNGGVGTIQNMWSRDIADPVDENEYGVHPIYMEHRFNATSSTSSTHGVFLLSANGADILLLTPPSSNTSLVQYRMIGGTFDFYFFSGPTPTDVMQQYAALVGTPTWQPYWGFGFHLCRWGYSSLDVLKDVVKSMRDANIPLETMWSDIDLYHAVRDFTSDPVSFPGEGMRQFIRSLKANNQHYIPIVDAAIAKEVNSSDHYNSYSKGAELDVFIKNPDGSEYVGQVWPGYTVFPDWFAPKALAWWTEALGNWSKEGVEYSGIWLDMNEASSFCDGSCGTGIDISNTSVPFILPGEPGNLVTDYPEGYNSTISGPSGNITVNGTLTYGASASANGLSVRGIGAGKQSGIEVNTPPYAIHNGNGRLSLHALATNATHQGGYLELDVHSLWGTMEAIATHKALKTLFPKERPFIISRSAFASAGKWTGHWLGDNFSTWKSMYYSIQGILQHQMFQIPMVGADTCGFVGNTDEELCSRWMQLAAFTPFYRNHNIKGAISQEPYRWDSVANASRTAIAVRYSLLPYWYSLFANASLDGTPPVRALFWEYPNQPELFAVDRQFLIGRDILVTPVLTPNVSTVDGIFPGKGKSVWRDWYTHDVVNASITGNTTLSAPLGHIPVHVRDGAAILLHQKPAYTVEETRQGPYALLVTLSGSGAKQSASGSAYVDDGASDPPGPARVLSFAARTGSVRIGGTGKYKISQKLAQVTVLGVAKKPREVSVDGKKAKFEWTARQQRLVVSGLSVDLNKATTVEWE